MLPLTFSSYFWAACQAVSQRIRCHHYEKVLQDCLATASITVHKKKITPGAGHLSVSSGIAVFEDNYIRLYKMHYLREINLDSWTSYTPSQCATESVGADYSNIFVLIEAQHIVNEDIRETHADIKLHVLALGQPVAWKTTDHFNMIMSCRLSELVQMVDAYGQDNLYLDENLEIKAFSTIHPLGSPQTLNGCKDSVVSKNTSNPSNSAEANDGSFSHTSIPNFCMNTVQIPHKHKMEKTSKPPNILVYCGADENSSRMYASVKSSLELCVNTDVYIIYHLSHVEMLSSPWVDNTALLLLSSCTQLLPEVEEKIKDYVFKAKGILLSFNTSIESSFSQKILDQSKDASQLFTFRFDNSHTIQCLQGGSFFCEVQGNSEIIVSYPGKKHTHDSSFGASRVIGSSLGQEKALIVKSKLDGGGTVVLSQLILEKDPAHAALDPSSFIALKSSNTGRLLALKHILASLGMDVSPKATPNLTPSYLLSQNQDLRHKFLSSVTKKLEEKSRVKTDHLCLTFVEKFDPSKQVAENLLPVITEEGSRRGEWLEGFDEPDYWGHLDTSSLGQIVLYTDVITSTMHVFEQILFSLPHSLGPVAIAGRQTSGRGRGGNMWLSPKGCAMFTFPLSFDVDSEIGQRIPFLQHLVSTAVVHGIRISSCYENLDLRLKWPNDIYYGKNMKLGGVIVTSTVMGSRIYATIGCGVNVANSDPTICINDIIQLSNRSSNSKETSGARPMPLLTPAGVIARTLSTLEKFLVDFEKHGHTHFCEIYYKYWLHGGVKVSLNLETEDGHGNGDIVGIDEYGFLCVRKQSGEVISVQPDGNSFDMMENLLYCKRRL